MWLLALPLYTRPAPREFAGENGFKYVNPKYIAAGDTKPKLPNLADIVW